MEVKEVKRVKQFHPFRDLSLKWSFALYVTVCIIAAILLTYFLSGFFRRLQDGIHKYYEILYQDDIYKQAYIVSDGEIVQNGGIWISTENIYDKFSKRDLILYKTYGILTVVAVPVSGLCILVAGVVFYLRKLKKPLAVLGSASAHIAAGDLDFKIEYENRNEFGHLTASFETMRESLQKTNREMWKMMEERRRLNAAFAHDLRTPLTVLRGYCDFLLKYIPEGKISGEKTISTLSTMDVYLKRLEGYTATMSSLQKLDEIELMPKEVNFNDLCEELKNITGILASGKKLLFRGNGEGMLYVDVSAVLQVCENLVSNAIRYAENEVKVTCGIKDGVLSVTVADDGSGFTPEALKNAAEPYFRDDKELTDTAHFGIGLYICRLICEKHGGTLVIENENDGGGKVTADFALLPHK
jgi:signal transduction histidine kinase